MSETIDDYRWLVGRDGQAWLERACELTVDRAAAAKIVSQLRKDLSAYRAHLVVEQIELRARAAEKFAHPQKLFFTKKGLEQATDEPLARWKAERFAAGTCVADLCCGIGGDLLALAGRGPAIGMDSDLPVAVLADANLQALERHGSRVVAAEASAAHWGDCAAWHCDPDRRAAGRRTTTVEQFSPGPPLLDALMELLPDAAIKLAPATTAPVAWANTAEREWLGSRRECRQQVAWFGTLARHPGKRVATIVERGNRRTVVEQSAAELDPARQCGRYVFEPHNAVLAAGLSASLGWEHKILTLSERTAYLTGDARIDDPALDAFEVLAVLPLDRKRLRAYCREHGLARLEIKKRGVAIDPEKLRKELAAKGDGAATILISPVGERVQAIVARRAEDHQTAQG